MRMRVRGWLCAALVVCCGVAGCGGAVGQVARRGAAAGRAGSAAGGAVPTGPLALIDTTGGRLSCRLYAKQAPELVAQFVGLADGSKIWADASGAASAGKPFYDGTALFGVADGLGGGDRVGQGRGAAGPALAGVKAAAVSLDRAGLLGMRIGKDGVSSSLFVILEHADVEYNGRIAVFGLCDAASVERVAAMSHALLSAGNRPAKPVAVNHVAIVMNGDALPPMAADVPAESVVPRIFQDSGVGALPSPEPTGPVAQIETTLGTLTCRLFQETPVATANFVGLANGTKAWVNPSTKQPMRGRRFYDGLHVNRVIPDFMVEQGDLPGDGTGDGSIGYEFANEVVPGLLFDRPGRLAYANSGPGTNSSEWFVTDQQAHNLDGNYTIFGQCDAASQSVVSAIARVPRNAKNQPLKPVVVTRILVK